MRRIVIACIRLYQCCVSPLLGRHCRFEPSCSHYAIEAITQHGALKGTGYAVWRLLRCQPLCKGGYDPVPTVRGNHSVTSETAANPPTLGSIQTRQRGGRTTHC